MAQLEWLGGEWGTAEEICERLRLLSRNMMPLESPPDAELFRHHFGNCVVIVLISPSGVFLDYWDWTELEDASPLQLAEEWLTLLASPRWDLPEDAGSPRFAARIKPDGSAGVLHFLGGDWLKSVAWTDELPHWTLSPLSEGDAEVWERFGRGTS
jgi:hypothetical protein